MESREDPEELEVTVEVVPSTVTEIVYLRGEADCDIEVSSNEEEEDEDLYQIGTVDVNSPGMENCSLMVDNSTQTVVLISSDFVNVESLYLNGAENAIKEEDEDLDGLSGPGDYVCTLCNFKCRSRSSLNQHREIHRANYTKCEYTCNVCGLQFPKAQILSHHFRITHESDFKKIKIEPSEEYMCDKCGAKYNNVKDLEDHQKTHKTNLLYACNKCGEGFSSTAEITIHLRHIHPNNNKNIFVPPPIDSLHVIDRKKRKK